MAAEPEPTVRVVAVHRAVPGERFARGAWDGSVGLTFPLLPVPGASTRLVAAEVSEDGASVELTFEVPASAVRVDATPFEVSSPYSLDDDQVADVAVASGWIADTPEARAAYLAGDGEER